MLLEIEDMHVHYGRIEALKGLSFTVDEGEIVTLIGANGAGKTTTLKAISGVRPVSAGKIMFDGRDITRVRRARESGTRHLPGAGGPGHLPGHVGHREPRDGHLHPQGPEVGGEGSRPRTRLQPVSPAARTPDASGRHALRWRAADARDRPRAHGAPRVLLLDEPSMGLAPMLVAQIFSIITEINQQGTTILLVEQNAAQALQRAHRAYVLETGRIVRSDDAKVLLGDDSVRAAYLGGDVEG